MIETERLLLRKPAPDDADDLVAIVGDPEVMRWLGGSLGERDAAARTLERWLARWEEDGVGHFVAVREGRVVGRIGFLVWDGSCWEVSSYAEAGEAAVTEIGWTIVREWWGHGFATEGARAVRDWGRARGVESLVSLIHPDNARSQRVAKKLGAAPAERVETAGGPAVVWRHPA